jgi:hypothetical protein
MIWLSFALFLGTTALYAIFSTLVLTGLSRHRESWTVMLPTVFVLLAFSVALVAQTISTFLEAIK